MSQRPIEAEPRGLRAMAAHTAHRGRQRRTNTHVIAPAGRKPGTGAGRRHG